MVPQSRISEIDQSSPHRLYRPAGRPLFLLLLFALQFFALQFFNTLLVRSEAFSSTQRHLRLAPDNRRAGRRRDLAHQRAGLFLHHSPPPRRAGAIGDGFLFIAAHAQNFMMSVPASFRISRVVRLRAGQRAVRCRPRRYVRRSWAVSSNHAGQFSDLDIRTALRLNPRHLRCRASHKLPSLSTELISTSSIHGSSS